MKKTNKIILGLVSTFLLAGVGYGAWQVVGTYQSTSDNIAPIIVTDSADRNFKIEATRVNNTNFVFDSPASKGGKENLTVTYNIKAISNLDGFDPYNFNWKNVASEYVPNLTIDIKAIKNNVELLEDDPFFNYIDLPTFDSISVNEWLNINNKDNGYNVDITLSWSKENLNGLNPEIAWQDLNETEYQTNFNNLLDAIDGVAFKIYFLAGNTSTLPSDPLTGNVTLIPSDNLAKTYSFIEISNMNEEGAIIAGTQNIDLYIDKNYELDGELTLTIDSNEKVNLELKESSLRINSENYNRFTASYTFEENRTYSFDWKLKEIVHTYKFNNNVINGDYLKFTFNSEEVNEDTEFVSGSVINVSLKEEYVSTYEISSLAFNGEDILETKSFVITNGDNILTGEVKESFDSYTISIGNDLVTFNGESSLFVNSEDFTFPTDEDIKISSKVEGNRSLLGWYYLDESNNRVRISTSELNTLLKDTTIYPYFSEEEGYFRVNKNSSTDTFPAGNSAFDMTNGKPDANFFSERFTRTHNTLVKGSNGLVDVGSRVTFTPKEETEVFKEFDYFRLDSGTNDGIKPDVPYTFIYNIENFSNETFSFELYQINSQNNNFSGTNNNATVSLGAHESATIRLTNVTFTGSQNDNILTRFIFRNKTLSSLDFGISIQYKQTSDDREAINKINVNGENIEKDIPSITLGNDLVYYTNDSELNTWELTSQSSQLPLKDEFSVSDELKEKGYSLAGWYYDNFSNLARSSSDNLNNFKTTIYHSNSNVFPYFNGPSDYINTNFGSGTNSGQPNGTSSKFKEINDTNFANQDIDSVVKGSNGIALMGKRIKLKSNVSGILRKDDYFRYDTKSNLEGGIKTNTVYNFTYNIENFSKERVSFELYQINSGTDLSSGKDNKGTVTLDPGCSGIISLNVTLTKGTNGNGNALTMFKLLSDAPQFDVGISLNYKNINSLSENERPEVIDTLNVLNN